MAEKLERLDNANPETMAECRKNVRDVLAMYCDLGAMSKLELDFCMAVVGGLNDAQFVSMIGAFGEEAIRILELKGEILRGSLVPWIGGVSLYER